MSPNTSAARPRVLKVIADAHAPDARVQKEIDTLSAAGFTVDVVCWDREQLPELLAYHREGHGEVHRYKGSSPRGRPFRFLAMNIFFWLFAARTARRIGPDFVHVHSIQVLPLGVFLRMILAVPLVYDVHEITETFGRNVSPKFGQWVWAIEQRLVRSVDLVVTVSGGLKERYAAALRPGAEAIELRNCLPVPDEIVRTARPEGAPFLIGRIGNLRPRSRVDMVADIILGLNARGHAVRFKYAGISLGTYGEVVAEHHARMSEFAEHHEWVPVEGFADFYADVDIVLNLHERGDLLEERFAYFSKVFEAMALGVPAVINDFPSMTPMVGPTGAGVVVEDFEVEAFIDAIEALIENPERIEAMRERARAYAMENLNWHVMGARLVAEYQALR